MTISTSQQRNASIQKGVLLTAANLGADADGQAGTPSATTHDGDHDLRAKQAIWVIVHFM